MNRVSSLRDFFKDNIVGFSESDNIEEFPAMSVSDDQNFECVEDSSFRKSSFTPKRIIFFDSVVRLDFVVSTKVSIAGFVTFALGGLFSDCGEPIDIKKNIKYKVVRKLITCRSTLKEDFFYNVLSLTSDGFSLDYEIELVDSSITRISELWNEIVLKSILPNLERGFIFDIIKDVDDNSILVKDGNLYGFTHSLNVFGHVKNFNVPRVVFDDKNLKGGIRSSIYKNKSTENVYSCFVDLGRMRTFRPLGGRGMFDYLRVDIVCDHFDSLVYDVVDRFNFISDYIFSSTSVFSGSDRFPQNTPMIESIERFLRTVSGDKRIISSILRKLCY
ncbi:MAG: hypothetical protein ACK4F9_02520 [Brevinematia bacterium]